MATATTLEFEKPLVELQNQIDELKKMAEKQQLTVGDEIVQRASVGLLEIRVSVEHAHLLRAVGVRQVAQEGARHRVRPGGGGRAGSGGAVVEGALAALKTKHAAETDAQVEAFLREHPDVSFALTEVHIGVVPAVISLTLLPRLDARAASRYYLTGERFGGAEAARIGLVTAYAGADDGVGVVLEPVLEGLRKAAPGALADAKKLVTARVLDAFDKEADALVTLSAHRFGSAEAKEGMEAFLERRERSWAL